VSPAEVSARSRALLTHCRKAAYPEVTFLPLGKGIQVAWKLFCSCLRGGVFCLCVFGFLALCLVVLFPNGINTGKGVFAETPDPNPSHRVSAKSYLAE